MKKLYFCSRFNFNWIFRAKIFTWIYFIFFNYFRFLTAAKRNCCLCVYFTHLYCPLNVCNLSNEFTCTKKTKLLLETLIHIQHINPFTQNDQLYVSCNCCCRRHPQYTRVSMCAWQTLFNINSTFSHSLFRRCRIVVV